MDVALLKNALGARESLSLDGEFTDFACVALLVRFAPEGTLLGFIRRSEHPLDPWSGQIALPGGRRDPGDASDVDAVLREVREEIGLELGAPLVRLHDVQARRAGAKLPFFLRPFVFSLDREPSLALAPSEVSAFHWISLRHLLDPDHHIDHNFERGEIRLKVPGVRFPSGDVLWGLTYVMLTDFLERLDAHSPARAKFLEGLDFSRWRKYPG